MSWLDGLIKFNPVLKKLKIANGNKFHLSLNITVNKNDNRSISLGDLSSKERRAFISDIVPKALEEGIDLLPSKFDGRVEEYSEKINLATNKEVLDFFREKIPSGDLPILKASLYLRSVLLDGGDTALLKQDILSQWGTRGGNISNLCSSRYFEDWFRPLYEQMSKGSDFNDEKFQKVYNEIVQYLPFSLFVNHSMNEDEIVMKIKQKIEMSEKYGLEIINIHGIGTTNVKRIREALDNLPEISQFEKNIEEESGVIVVRLRKHRG